MKVGYSYVCYSCEEVFNRAPHGSCPACGSDNIFALSWLGRPEEERRQWFTKISGARFFAGQSHALSEAA